MVDVRLIEKERKTTSRDIDGLQKRIEVFPCRLLLSKLYFSKQMFAFFKWQIVLKPQNKDTWIFFVI